MRPRSLLRLAFTGIAGSGFRGWLIGGCALLVAGFVLATVLPMRGAQDSLSLARERLGADIVVVPRASETRVEGALLMGNATNTYLPAQVVPQIVAVSGVEVASPQLYLLSMANSSCCSVSLMFLVAYDPATDFTIEPWLKEELGRELAVGEAVGGTHVFVPDGQKTIKLYGYDFSLQGNLEPTGTNLDQTLFMTFQSAYDMERTSITKAKQPLPILESTVSSVMVKVKPGANPDSVARAIMHAVPGTTAVVGPQMFGSYSQQISGVLRTMLIVVALMVVLSLVAIAVVFWMSVHARHRQIGVLRALGATKSYVLLGFMTEAAILALAGGLIGTILVACGLYVFRNGLVSALGFPFLFPSFWSLLALIVGGLALALVVVALAAVFPAWRASRQEPADAMRE
jgi:putative ABC transport system permease protein